MLAARLRPLRPAAALLRSAALRPALGAPSPLLESGCAAACSVRGLAGRPDTTAGRKRRENFWSKWRNRSQQDFWQEVGFDHDRAHERRTMPKGVRGGPRAAARNRLDEKARGDETRHVELSESEFYLAEDALEAMEGAADFEDAYDDLEYADDDAPPEPFAVDFEVPTDFGTAAADARAAAAARSLRADKTLDPSRRAELLGLLEDLGPYGLEPSKPMPREDPSLGLSAASDLEKPDIKDLIGVTNSYIDSAKMREPGTAQALRPGDYFGYLLNTRRVSKVGPQGKRTSYSCLVVIGNGAGVAGLGMGKDLQPGVALLKATRTAKKNLMHIDRFDDRCAQTAPPPRPARTPPRPTQRPAQRSRPPLSLPSGLSSTRWTTASRVRSS